MSKQTETAKRKRKSPFCRWNEDSEAWQSECGGLFTLEAGTPLENNMNFCCFCGKKLAEKL